MTDGPRRWVIATGNAGKLREMQAILCDLDIELVAQSEFSVTEAVEDGASFIENALIKARHGARQTGLPAVADDSGLCVDALEGAPGIHSARFAGEGASDEDNVGKLLGLLQGKPDTERRACFYCAIVVVTHWQDPMPIVCTGRWDGHIGAAPLGVQGFGYDPVFMPRGLAVTSAQLTPAQKNRISHRGQALAELRRHLNCAAAASATTV